MREDRAFERLAAANPLSDTAQFEPTRADAIAFLRGIEEQTLDTRTLTNRPITPPRRTRQWPIAMAAFIAVVAAGATAAVFPGGDDSSPATNAATATTAVASPVEAGVEEPAELAELRAAVNAGDPLAAATVHAEDGDCDRFFTTGGETCADWYRFLVGIGTRVTAARCEADPDGGLVNCWWTVESDAHRALGINTVEWTFTSVSVEGWGTAQPDGNLFSGVTGLGALDSEFWKFVSSELVREDPELAEVVASSNRVPATLNADFAAVVLDAATSYTGS